MRKFVLPFCLALGLTGGLGGCANLSSADQANIATCAAAMVASGAVDPAAALAAVALNPACMALEQSLLQELASSVSGGQKARMARHLP